MAPERAPSGSVVRVLFDDAAERGVHQRSEDDGDAKAAMRQSQRATGCFSRTASMALCAMLCAFALYECTKLNTCYVQESELLARDYDAIHETVCTDATKVARFAHRFDKGCRDAMLHYKEGLTHGMYTCFVAKHTVYTVLALDNVYLNAAAAVLAVIAMWLYKDYRAQVEMARLHADMLSSSSRSMLAHFDKRDKVAQ